MAKGGYRPGSGRKAGKAGLDKLITNNKLLEEVKAKYAHLGNIEDPLEVMLLCQTMAVEEQNWDKAFERSSVLAPFFHGKAPSAVEHTVKTIKDDASVAERAAHLWGTVPKLTVVK